MENIKNFLFKNSTAKQTVAKNTVWLFSGEMLGRLLKLVVIVFATRVLSVSGWGVFSYALAFVSIFYVFGDIGINTFITREMAKGGDDKYQYLAASLFLKLLLLALSLVVSLVLIPHFGTVTLSLKIVLALALLNFSDSLREFVLSVNRALEKMEREAFIKIAINIVTTALGIALLIIHPTPLSLAIAYAAGSIIGSIIAIWVISDELAQVQWKFSAKTIRVIIDFAWPFVATTIFAVLIANVDTVMLGQLKSTVEVGLYAAAERIVQFLAVIPIFIGLSTFPLLSKSESDPEASRRIFEKVMVLVLVIGFPITIGGILLRSTIMNVIFGPSYAAGALVLGILMLSVCADFANIILNNMIFVKKLQKKFVIAALVGVAVNVGLNFWLIPRYGAIGAAISSVTAQAFILAVSWRIFKKFFSFSIMPKLGRVAAATIVMAAVLALCSAVKIHFIISIVAAAAAYFATLHVFDEPALAELLAMVKSYV